MISKLVKDILTASGSAMPAERILLEIRERGFRNITKKELLDHLQFSKSNNLLREIPVPGRATLGWCLPLQRNERPSLPAVQHRVSERLYNWQRKALVKWEADGYRGIIEAVTGSGKTMVALAAWENLKGKYRPLNTLVVVPTVELMNQWHARFQEAFPEISVGRIGDQCHDDFSRFTICISTIHSAVRQVHALLSHRHRSPLNTFLIADECHRYIEPAQFQKIRHFPFTFSLGLSATIEPYQVSGLGRIVETYTFSDAVRDELVPPFDMLNVSVKLTRAEQNSYEDLTEELHDRIVRVKNAFAEELRETSPDRFFRTLQKLVLRPDGTKDTLIVGLFGVLFKRASIAYKAERKMALANELTQLLLNDGRKKMIGFFERIRSAEDLANDMEGTDSLDLQTANSLRAAVLEAGPNWCRVLHSGLPRADRHSMLAEFKSAKVAALLACRVLDEGVDVPEIDAALLVASTQSKRQRIQRIGRALRRGDGRKRPIIITLFVPETNDRHVTEEDSAVFGNAAMIHMADESACVSKLKDILASR